MPTPEAKLRANKKYHDKFHRLQIRVSPEENEIIERHALLTGESVNGFVKRAICETIARDEEKAPK